MFGRAAMGEVDDAGFLADRWRIRRGGKLAFAESLRLDGAIAGRLGEAAIANGHAAIGTVLLAPGDDATVEAVRAALPGTHGEAGISAWGGIALVRLVAPDGAALRHDLVIVLAALGRGALPRLWLN